MRENIACGTGKAIFCKFYVSSGEAIKTTGGHFVIDAERRKNGALSKLKKTESFPFWSKLVAGGNEFLGHVVYGGETKSLDAGDVS